MTNYIKIKKKKKKHRTNKLLPYNLRRTTIKNIPTKYKNRTMHNCSSKRNIQIKKHNYVHPNSIEKSTNLESSLNDYSNISNIFEGGATAKLNNSAEADNIYEKILLIVTTPENKNNSMKNVTGTTYDKSILDGVLWYLKQNSKANKALLLLLALITNSISNKEETKSSTAATLITEEKAKREAEEKAKSSAKKT